MLNYIKKTVQNTLLLQFIWHIANYILTLQPNLTNYKKQKYTMTTWNLNYMGEIAYSEHFDIFVTHYTLGKYQVLMYTYKGYKTRVIKYTNIPEMLQDFRSRIYYLSFKNKRNMLYTKYGEESIKNWYKITNG